jgi:hypothetical protein
VTGGDTGADRSSEPWFADARTAARLRDGSRVLMLTTSSPDQVHAVLAAIGKDGSLTVLEPDRDRAAALDGIRHPGLAVLSYEPDGQEVFGTHDALLACPPASPSWPLNRYGELALRNLRPGATFVLDLPAVDSCPIVRDEAAALGLAPDNLKGLQGPGTGGLVRLLRADGLRNVEASTATHLVRFENPYALARHVGRVLPNVDEAALASLQLAFARRFATNDAFEVPFHRERIVALR